MRWHRIIVVNRQPKARGSETGTARETACWLVFGRCACVRVHESPTHGSHGTHRLVVSRCMLINSHIMCAVPFSVDIRGWLLSHIEMCVCFKRFRWVGNAVLEPGGHWTTAAHEYMPHEFDYKLARFFWSLMRCQKRWSPIRALSLLSEPFETHEKGKTFAKQIFRFNSNDFICIRDLRNLNWRSLSTCRSATQRMQWIYINFQTAIN